MGGLRVEFTDEELDALGWALKKALVELEEQLAKPGFVDVWQGYINAHLALRAKVLTTVGEKLVEAARKGPEEEEVAQPSTPKVVWPPPGGKVIGAQRSVETSVVPKPHDKLSEPISDGQLRLLWVLFKKWGGDGSNERGLVGWINDSCGKELGRKIKVGRVDQLSELKELTKREAQVIIPILQERADLVAERERKANEDAIGRFGDFDDDVPF